MLATATHDACVDDPAEFERSAFNAAFYELGLHVYWDKGTYRKLAANPSERDRVRGYLEREHPHLLRAYDADFLTDAVIRAKQRCQRLLTGSAHAAPELNWTEGHWAQTGF